MMPERQAQTGGDHDTVLALRLGPDDDVAVLTADATPAHWCVWTGT